MLVVKLFLIFYILALIFIAIFFIVKSKTIFNKLKHSEHIFKNTRKKIVHNFIPVTQNISKYNKNLQMILHLKNYSLKEHGLFWGPLLLSSLTLFQGIKASFNSLRKLLR